jgi:hypothetical protein
MRAVSPGPLLFGDVRQGFPADVCLDLFQGRAHIIRPRDSCFCASWRACSTDRGGSPRNLSPPDRDSNPPPRPAPSGTPRMDGVYIGGGIPGRGFPRWRDINSGSPPSSPCLIRSSTSRSGSAGTMRRLLRLAESLGRQGTKWVPFLHRQHLDHIEKVYNGQFLQTAVHLVHLVNGLLHLRGQAGFGPQQPGQMLNPAVEFLQQGLPVRVRRAFASVRSSSRCNHACPPRWVGACSGVFRDQRAVQ